MLTLSAPALTVPAHGTAAATVTLDPDAAVTGLFGGRLTATPATGAPLHISIGASVEAESYSLTVHTIARTGGAPPTSLLMIADPADPSTAQIGETDPDGNLVLRLPRGTYGVAGYLAEPVSGDSGEPLSAVAQTGIALTAPTAITLDARTAKPVTVAVAGEPTARQLARSQTLILASGTKVLRDTASGGADTPYYAQTRAVPGVRFDTHTTWARPDVTVTLAGRTPLAAVGSYTGLARPAVGVHDYSVVDGGQARPEELARVDVRGKIVLLRYDLDSVDPLDQMDAVAAAGGAGAVFSDVAGGSLSPFAPPIPMLTVSDITFADLAARVAAGPVTGRFTVNPPSPYSYQLLQTEQGRLPGGLTYLVDKAALARVDVQYRSYGGPGNAVVYSSPIDVRTGLVLQWLTVDTPLRRIEYYTAGQWSTELDFDGKQFASRFLTSTATYQAGRTYRREWNVAVVAPKLAGLPDGPLGSDEPSLPAVARTGDTVTATIASLSDAVSGRTGYADDPDTGDVTLLRDGQDLGSSGALNSGSWDVPAAPAGYELRQTVQRDMPGWNLSTKVATSWTFRSGHVDGDVPAALPLLDVGYAVPLDERNTMPAARPDGFGITVTRQAGSGPGTVHSVRCEVSFDDGQSWHPLPVRRSGSSWQVSPPAGGRPGGYASLRVTAIGSDGATVHQTVTRAFALR
jgi:hypothetical protein